MSNKGMVPTRGTRGTCRALERKMSKFKELEDFEHRFEQMSVEELRTWRTYWKQHAEHLAPKVRKEAMKRVHKIEKAITRKELEQP